MKMSGMEHDMLMPGMMTDDNGRARPRGPEFDLLFLIGMIKHHQGDRHGRRVVVAWTWPRTKRSSSRPMSMDQSIEIDRKNDAGEFTPMKSSTFVIGGLKSAPPM
jgi:hypothetical protein